MRLIDALRRVREPDFHKTRTGRRAYGVLGAGLFVAIGAGLLALVVNDYRDAAAVDGWIATPCVVERVEVVDEWDPVDERVEYRIDAAFAYHAAGQPRRGTRWTRRADVEFTDCAEASRTAVALDDAAQTVCFVNPADPDDAVLVRGADGFAAGFVFPIAMIGLGVLIGTGMWIGRLPGGSTLRGAWSRVRSRGTPWGDRGVAVAFVVVGLIATAAIGVAVVALRADLAGWAATPAVVVVSEEAFGTRSPGETEREHWARVWYEYEVSGRRYRSDRFSAWTPHVSRAIDPARPGDDDVDAHLAALPVGVATTCYVDPDDPFSAVLHREGRAALWWAAVPSPLLLIGGLGLWATRARPTRRGAATAEDHFG